MLHKQPPRRLAKEKFCPSKVRGPGLCGHPCSYAHDIGSYSIPYSASGELAEVYVRLHEIDADQAPSR